MPVAWLRDTLSEPGGRYAVDMVRLNFGPDGGPEEWHTVPVGTNYFDRSCRVSSQVFALVEADALPAVSLEFRPVPGFLKSLGRSPLEPRDAYRFARADVFGLAVCAKGVCPHALTVKKSAAVAEQVPPALARIIADRRVNVGGSYEPLHPYILKALLPLAPQPTRTTVRVEKSAMEPDDMQTGNEAAVAEAMPEDEGGGVAHNGVTALYAHADAITEACDQLEADLEKTDNPQLYQEGLKLCDMARALAEKVKASGDKHDAKLQAMKDGGEESEPEAEPDGDEAAPEMDKDDEGVFKSVRPPYKPLLKAMKVKRFKLADLNAVQKSDAPETPAEALQRIKRDEPEKYALIERELRLIAACS
jgi:hypothetical protein